MEVLTEVENLPHLDKVFFGKVASLMPPAAMAEFVSVFLTDANSRLERIEQAVLTGDADEAHRAAHSLKGSSSMLGLTRMAALCGIVEESASESRMAPAAAAIPALTAELAHLRQLMTSVVTLSLEQLQTPDTPS